MGDCTSLDGFATSFSLEIVYTDDSGSLLIEKPNSAMTIEIWLLNEIVYDTRCRWFAWFKTTGGMKDPDRSGAL